eukprot:CAMPEP_0181227708 /NCGR_PEP_ID=MMETSP1096-20121128/32939_1 /TAXON_ID=156174 ORGANISM="Chrysochromulina ericina, Strain CCMP281" /NCGR_SAMPLE_ID=MMETSP1096 /ASSEMBLY_ACC=CAM_ASM_000453 /LENGTH=86 /DNA_ID=CAMNT_0023321145 /DNA_START=664 /DNA_END=924 /DNA_ORIENTATION=-
MRNGAVTAKVEVPPIVLLTQAHLRHLCLKHLQSLFALAATNELSNTRHQEVHGGHCSAVRVVPHVESFNRLRIVVDKRGGTKSLLG